MADGIRPDHIVERSHSTAQSDRQIQELVNGESASIDYGGNHIEIVNETGAMNRNIDLYWTYELDWAAQDVLVVRISSIARNP